ncbi:MAG TPA: YbhB/YbcL family Raf kinase inhibitor-like protein [Rhizomicrobium sp.]|jgi:hypothetical protein
MTFALSSPAFAANGKIPQTHAQAGRNISPPLSWSGVPEQAKSLVLIVEDPDAPVGTFTHWAAYDIPPDRRELPEAAHGLKQGRNDMGHARYDGPKPPKGHGLHHYHFRLSALDVPSLDLPADASYREIKAAVRGHTLAETELVGTFETH